MSNISRRSRGKKRGKSKNKEFMDAALDAFIRDQSLQKWNEVQGLKAGAEVDQKEAVKSSSEFFEKGQFRNLWQRWWQNEVIEAEHDNHEHLFAKIERIYQNIFYTKRSN